jgi:hypothetical protein
MASSTNFNFAYSNEVFRIGWLLDKKLAETYLQALSALASDLAGRGVYESDTAAIFVEPLLRGLGWETLNHDEVDRAPRGHYPDYELYGQDRKGTPKRLAVIEVEGLDTPDNYLRREALSQLAGYARGAHNPERVLILDGNRVVRGVVTDFVNKQQTPVCEFELRNNADSSSFVKGLGRDYLIQRFGLESPSPTSASGT